MEKALAPSVAIVIMAFVMSIVVYPQMPELMASHWNIAGQVNGWLPKIVVLFLMPVLSFLLLLLFAAIPKIDPLKTNIKRFRIHFDIFVFVLMAFLFYLHALTIFWGAGFRFNLIQLLSPAFAVLFYYIGVMLEKTRKNWFIGIRTPWTMSNQRVWVKTHHLGGKLFKAAGVIALLGIPFPGYEIWFVFVPLIVIVIYTFVYSYFEYQKYR